MEDRRSIDLLALVFLGGFAGVLARAVVNHGFPDGDGFPITTFVINLSGAFALAVLIESLGHHSRLRFLLGTGFLGGYTTYSALAMQTDTLLRAGEPLLALGYAGATVIVGFLASVVGIVLIRRMRPR